MFPQDFLPTEEAPQTFLPTGEQSEAPRIFSADRGKLREGTRFTFEQEDRDLMLETLRQIPWKRQSRHAIDGFGMCAGATFGRSGSTVAHLEAPEMRAAVGTINEILSKYLKPLGLQWTCLQLNYNSRARPHCDKNNRPHTAVISVGTSPFALYFNPHDRASVQIQAE